MLRRPAMYIFLLAICFNSCVSEVVLPLEGEGKLYVETDLSRSSKRIEARLSTVTNFSDVTNVLRPQDAKIRLLSGTDIELEFDYDEIEGVYYIPRSKHIIQSKWTYRLTAQLSDDPDANVMTASTDIPVRVRYAETSSAKLQLSDEENSVKIHLDLPEEGYYRVLTHRVKKQLAEDGTVIIAKDQHVSLRFDIGHEDPLAYHKEVHNYGVLVDASRLKEIDLTYFDEKVDGELADQYLVELQHLTEASYRYHLSKSKQLSAIEQGSSDPVINYTNIKGGYGVLGAFTAYKDTLSIQ